MQHVKNAIGGNAMKMLKMHQNALKCTRMRMGKINTTFGKKQHGTPPTMVPLLGIVCGGVEFAILHLCVRRSGVLGVE